MYAHAEVEVRTHEDEKFHGRLYTIKRKSLNKEDIDINDGREIDDGEIDDGGIDGVEDESDKIRKISSILSPPVEIATV